MARTGATQMALATVTGDHVQARALAAMSHALDDLREALELVHTLADTRPAGPPRSPATSTLQPDMGA